MKEYKRIKDLWNSTTEPDVCQFQYLQTLNVSFDQPLSLIAKILHWRKRIYDFQGVNIIAGFKMLPFQIREDIIDNKKCIVLDYGYMQDYIRPFKDSFIGVCVIRNSKVLWFMLSKHIS